MLGGTFLRLTHIFVVRLLFQKVAKIFCDHVNPPSLSLHFSVRRLRDRGCMCVYVCVLWLNYWNNVHLIFCCVLIYKIKWQLSLPAGMNKVYCYCYSWQHFMDFFGGGSYFAVGSSSLSVSWCWPSCFLAIVCLPARNTVNWKYCQLEILSSKQC